MFVATSIIGAILGAMFIGMGAGKVAGKLDTMRLDTGLSGWVWRLEGATGAAGGIGVLVGLVEGIWGIGVAAGIGLALQTALAMGFHARRRDSLKDSIAAVVMFGLSVGYVILRIASA